jgi:hypothetical protein
MGLLSKVTDTLDKHPYAVTGVVALVGGVFFFVARSSRPVTTTSSVSISHDKRVSDITQQIGKPQDKRLQEQIRIVERKDPFDGTNLAPEARTVARALPNQRLQDTFGVDNIFTSTDRNYNIQFRNGAVQKMQEAISYHPGEYPPDWADVVSFIRAAVQKKVKLRSIGEGNLDNEIPLAELAQFVTLEVSLCYLFPQSPHNYSEPAAITTLAKKINDLWLQSKSENVPLWKDQTDMLKLLRDVTGQDPLDPKDNPMNFILPAYETMWRVVFRGLLEINFRRGGHDAKMQVWKALLGRFFEDQRAIHWLQPDNVFELSTIDVIKEVFRLYPPTRRIYRQYPDPTGRKEADLEQMHRNINLGGRDPDAFRPQRWVELKQAVAAHNTKSTNNAVEVKKVEEEFGFMPFAKVCPADKTETRAFGWNMVALLIAGIIEGLGGLRPGFASD